MKPITNGTLCIGFHTVIIDLHIDYVTQFCRICNKNYKNSNKMFLLIDKYYIKTSFTLPRKSN